MRSKWFVLAVRSCEDPHFITCRLANMKRPMEDGNFIIYESYKTRAEAQEAADILNAYS